MTTAILIGAGVAVLALAVLAGQRLLRTPSTGGGVADGLGSFIDVFDPGQARSGRQLKEYDDKTEVAPSPDDSDLPVSIDLESGIARIRRSERG